MRMKKLDYIYPPPGYNLELPDWTAEEFLRRIGGDCEEFAEKFESLEEVFHLNRLEMKKRGVPTAQRKYILRCREMMRRGLRTFEYLSRRTCLDPVPTR